MARMIWLVLNDGRSVVGGCGSATREMLASALAEPARILTVTSDDGVEHIPTAHVRDFVLFDAPASAVARLLRV